MAYFRSLIVLASLRICAGVSTFSSTIPARNCSAEPAQNRSMICRTDRAARLCGGGGAGGPDEVDDRLLQLSQRSVTRSHVTDCNYCAVACQEDELPIPAC